jgi:ATP-dependent helicase STH1/SNF2
LNFLLPKIFSSCDEFKKWFEKPLSKLHPMTNRSLQNKGEQASFDLSEEERLLVINRLHQVLTPFLLRREKTQVEKELPPKVAIVIKVELSDWQKKIYNLILKGKLAKNPLTGKSSN